MDVSELENRIQSLLDESEHYSGSNPRYAILLARMAAEAIIVKKFHEVTDTEPTKSVITIGDIQTRSFEFLKKEFSPIGISSFRHVNQMASPFLHFNTQDFFETPDSRSVRKILRELHDILDLAFIEKQNVSNEENKFLDILDKNILRMRNFIEDQNYIRGKKINFSVWDKANELGEILLQASKEKKSLNWKTMLELEFSFWIKNVEPYFTRERLTSKQKAYQNDATDENGRIKTQTNAHMYAQGITELLTYSDEEIIEKEKAIKKALLVVFFAKYGGKGFSRIRTKSFLSNEDLRSVMHSENCIVGPQLLIEGYDHSILQSGGKNPRKKYTLKGNWLFMEFDA